MGTFFNAMRRGLAAMRGGDEPAGFAVGGRQVTCPHCGQTEFAKGSAMLNTAGMTFLGLDWANKTATTLICAECGRIEWFAQEPVRV